MTTTTAKAKERPKKTSSPGCAESAAPAAPRRKRQVFGCETPRLFTPPLRPLEPRSPATERRTEGYAVIDFATDVLKVDLYPWQRWLLIHALELVEDGSFRFRNIVVLVARQQGKSMLGQVLALYFLFILGVRLVLGTAQDLDTAEEVWDGALELIEDTPVLAAQALKPIKVNGKKAIRLKSGERYKVKAANRRAGRGLSGDLLLLDELREHQTWDAWGAITKTMIARPNSMAWCMSNAGDVTSVVLRYLRKIAHASLGDPDGIVAADDPTRLLPDDDAIESATGLADEGEDFDLDVEDFEVDDDTLFLAEWSMPPGAFKASGAWPPRPTAGDLDALAQANPSLGYGLVTLRSLMSALRTDPEWTFRTEVGCQWSEGTLQGIFPPGSWEAGMDPDSRIAEGSRRVLCLSTSHDRAMTHVALAGFREDGAAHVEIIKVGPGQEWVEDFLKASEGRYVEVTGQKNGAAVSTLLPALKVAELPVVDWAGADLGIAHGSFFDAVRDGHVRHRPAPIIDVPAATAVPRVLSGAWVVDLKASPIDASPLAAVIGAHWLLTRAQAAPVISEYETGRLEVI